MTPVVHEVEEETVETDAEAAPQEGTLAPTDPKVEEEVGGTAQPLPECS